MAGNSRIDATLFGEAQSRVVISVRADDVARLGTVVATDSDIELVPLGTVTENAVLELRIGDTPAIELDVAELRKKYESALPGLMAAPVAV
jgi:phosphoribosylformylglycinamidine synthase